MLAGLDLTARADSGPYLMCKLGFMQKKIKIRARDMQEKLK